MYRPPTGRQKAARGARKLARKLRAFLFPWQPPEAARKRTWHDILAAVLLLPMGVGAMVVGLIFRHALGSRFLAYEGFSAIPFAGGMAALRFGVCSALSTVWPSFSHDDEERSELFPTLLCGLPFLAFAFGCGAVIGALLVSESPGRPRVEMAVRDTAFMILCMGFIGGIVLFLLVPLGTAIVRACRRKRRGSRRRPVKPEQA